VYLLGVLLHEAVHIHLKMHCCPQCWSADFNYHTHGHHGRAWQLLAAKVENCFVLWTGLPIDLARFISLKEHWKHLHSLPSLHDLQEWNFENEILVQFYASELMEAYKACSTPGEFCLTKFGKNWWANPRVLGTVVFKDGCDWYKLLGKKRKSMLCGGIDNTEEYDPSGLMIRRAPIDAGGEWYTVAVDVRGQCSPADCLVGIIGSVPWSDYRT
jgi:hypothetical protein